MFNPTTGVYLTLMKLNSPQMCVRTTLLRARFLLCLAALLCLGGLEARAQKSFKKTYPAQKNVRLQLINISGTVVVEGWNRNEIKLTAEMEAPYANLAPQQNGDTLLIDLKNQNRSDAGSVNFHIWTPNSAMIDIETGQGNISIKDINGPMVRAHVWLSGEIELLNLNTASILASNTTGDIFFDGILARGGKYEFKSTQGNINIRIPGDSAFSLNATSPGRSINLGVFGGSVNQNDPRKVFGQIGNNANTSLVVSNQKGRIAFIKR
jgi:hypothetical protein